MRIQTTLLAALLTLGASALPRNAKTEKAVEARLARMTLDEKIGQMVQVESNMVALVHPEYSFEALQKMSRSGLDAVLRRFKLDDTYKADRLLVSDGQPAPNAAYDFYTIAQRIGEQLGYELDPAKLRLAFGQHKIGSVLNMLGGLHASDVATWRKAIKGIQDAALSQLGTPCLYGLDQVHGTTYSIGGTIFPQPIAMSATFNPGLIRRVGEICAYETRACGVPWVFVPDLDLGRNPAWSRQYEGVGEDACLGSAIGVAYLRGFQGDDPNHIDPFHVGTCLKHFVGYGVTANGRDRVPGQVSDMELREKYFKPFRDAFEAGALSAMTNSSILNGMNGVANGRLLTGWLKEGLNWDGMIVTDWADIENLVSRDHIAPDRKAGIIMAVNAGVDMMMVPSRWDYGPLLREAVEEGLVAVSRIDDAARRILRLKCRLGLFDNPLPEAGLYPKFGCREHADVARQVALESETLLKNEPLPGQSHEGGRLTLPISLGSRILVCGPNADNMRAQNGGWTYTWQGEGSEPFTRGYKTFYKALADKFGSDKVSLCEGVRYANLPSQPEAEQPADYAACTAAAGGADYIVCCIGENSYAETTGNIGDLSLSAQQAELVRRLAATGKPLVLVLNQGRCRLISGIEPIASAIVDVMLPGNYGAEALAELLAGDANFSGRLPMTYPSQPHAFTTYDYKVCEVRETMEGVYNYEAKTAAQWWFGTGLSYTKFEYSGLRVSPREFTASDTLEVQVDVRNAGQMAGKETVMLFSSDLVASLIPDNRRLRAFDKIALEPGETRTVTLRLPATDLAFVASDGRWTLEPGDFRLAVGGLSATVTYRD